MHPAALVTLADVRRCALGTAPRKLASRKTDALKAGCSTPHHSPTDQGLLLCRCGLGATPRKLAPQDAKSLEADHASLTR